MKRKEILASKPEELNGRLIRFDDDGNLQGTQIIEGTIVKVEGRILTVEWHDNGTRTRTDMACPAIIEII